MGVNVGPSTSIVDMLEQAQKIYHQSNAPQQKQYEAQLSASGVSDDLIVMIKSEKDAREEYTRSIGEAATENRKALDAASDALAALQASATNVANAIITLLEPSIEKLAGWASQGATELSGFVDKVIAAGGGVDGFMDVLRQDSPQLATMLDNVGKALGTMGEAIDVVTFGLKEIGRVGSALADWFDVHLGYAMSGGGNGTQPPAHPLTDAVKTVAATAARLSAHSRVTRAASRCRRTLNAGSTRQASPTRSTQARRSSQPRRVAVRPRRSSCRARPRCNPSNLCRNW
jgi:hypothetical protein